MTLALVLHLLGAVVWIGGMLAMLLVVRPTVVAQLEPPQRLRFLSAALGRFFPWVWGAVVALPLSGYWLLISLYGSLGNAPLYLHLMQLLGWIMIAIFLWLVGVGYPHLRAALAADKLPAAAAAMEQIRQLVRINALLGVLILVVAGGRYWI